MAEFKDIATAEACWRESEMLRKRLVGFLNAACAELPWDLRGYSWESLGSAVARLRWEWERERARWTPPDWRIVPMPGSRFL